MKRFMLFVLVFVTAVTLFGCVPKKFNDLETQDYEKYLEYTNYSSTALTGSPLSYNVLKGHNALADFDYTIIRVKSYWFTYYAGDPSLLLNEKFPDAKIILSYSGYYYIGK